MTEGKDIWGKHCNRVVDQRRYGLPPTWIERPMQSYTLRKRGRYTYISGKRRELSNRILRLMNYAERMIVLSSFLLADQQIEDAVIEAAKRKVRVYILLASETRLDIEHTDDEFETAMFEQHQNMLNRLGGYALFRSAPNFHAKFVLTDPNYYGTGLLLTANLTKEALERNQELGVELTHTEVKETFALARWAFWEYAEHELIDPKNNFRSIKPLGSVTHPTPAVHILGTTSKFVQLREEATRLIELAQKEILVASFGWEKDHEVVKYLCTRACEGLQVTVLARLRESQMPALLTLAESGARVLGFKWLHAKVLCADRDSALVMSANLQRDGLDRGFELGVKLNRARAHEVHDRLLGWSSTASWELVANPVIGDILGGARIWCDDQFFDISVKDKIHVNLRTVIADSADKLEDAASPELPSVGKLPMLAHEVEYEWQVIPPVLAVNSKSVFRSSNDKKVKRVEYVPPVFDEPSGRRVVAIDSPKDIDRARQVANELNAKVLVLRRPPNKFTT